MTDDVLLGKRASLERCVEQARRYYLASAEPLETDFLRQDAIAMNLQRACELAIDMANRAIRLRKLGLPQDSRESFLILGREGVLPLPHAEALARMVGFRNVLVHRYRDIDLAVMRDVVERRLDDVLALARTLTEPPTEETEP